MTPASCLWTTHTPQNKEMQRNSMVSHKHVQLTAIQKANSGHLKSSLGKNTPCMTTTPMLQIPGTRLPHAWVFGKLVMLYGKAVELSGGNTSLGLSLEVYSPNPLLALTLLPSWGRSVTSQLPFLLRSLPTGMGCSPPRM